MKLNQPLNKGFRGTKFQKKVWKEILKIPKSATKMLLDFGKTRKISVWTKF